MLQAVAPDTGRAFPANGKIIVKYAGKTAEALLELPAPSTRDGAAELPAVVWLTVGLLATHTFALQVPHSTMYTRTQSHVRASVYFCQLLKWSAWHQMHVRMGMHAKCDCQSCTGEESLVKCLELMG